MIMVNINETIEYNILKTFITIAHRLQLKDQDTKKIPFICSPQFSQHTLAS